MKNLFKNLFTNRTLKLLLFIVVLLNISMPAWAHSQLDGIAMVIGIVLTFLIIVVFLVVPFVTARFRSNAASICISLISAAMFIFLLRSLLPIIAYQLFSSHIRSDDEYFFLFINLTSMTLCLANMFYALHSKNVTNRERYIIMGLVTLSTIHPTYLTWEQLTRKENVDALQVFLVPLIVAILCLLNINGNFSRLVKWFIKKYKYIIYMVLAACAIFLVHLNWKDHKNSVYFSCFEAIGQGNENKVLYCIKKFSGKTKVPTNMLQQMIDKAIAAKQPEIIKLLILKGADCVDRNLIGILAGTGDIELIRDILDRQKNDTQKDCNVSVNGIDLKYAVLNKKYDMIKFLVSRGVNVASAADTAYRDGDKDTVKWLIKNNMVNNIHMAVFTGDIEIVKEALKKDAGINIKGRDGYAALMEAIKDNNLNVVKLLLAAGADVNIKYGNTALMEAVRNNNLEIVKSLLAAGADVNTKYERGNTALMEAVRNNNSEIVKSLITAGADVNAKEDHSKNSALWIAIEKENKEIIKLLIDAGANNLQSALMKIIGYRFDTEILKILLDAGVDINAKNEDGETALSKAAFYSSGNSIKGLLAAGADISTLKYGVTYLLRTILDSHQKFTKDDEKAFKRLIDAGADINTVGANGETLLFGLLRSDDIGEDFIKMVIEYGADVNVRNIHNDTPLDILSKNNPKYQLLRKYGAKTYEELNGTIPFTKSQE